MLVNRTAQLHTWGTTSTIGETPSHSVSQSDASQPSAVLCTELGEVVAVLQCAVESSAITIGRDEQATILLAASHVSRRHAMIQWDDIELAHFIIYAGSSNGTFINGQRIVRAARLEDGDLIAFGGTALIYRRRTAT